MLKISFFAVVGFALLLNAVGITANLTDSHSADLRNGQTPTPTISPTVTPTESPTVSPTVTPVPTPCFPDDPKKPCPTPTPTAEPVPTTSPTMRP